jgi:hypothetical protein
VPLLEPGDEPSLVNTLDTLRVGIDNGRGLSGNSPDPVLGLVGSRGIYIV